MKKLTSSLFWLVALFPPVSLGRDFLFFEPIRPPRAWQVMAHRGASRQAPENTRAAIQRAIEDGFEWAEVDVRLTRDGRHIIFHDDRLEGKTNGSGPVKASTLAELLKLDAGSWFARRYAGERLLSLKECLEMAKGKINLYLDCKDVNPQLLVEEILEAGMEKQVVVFDNLPHLRLVRDISERTIAIMPKWHPSLGLSAWIDETQPDAVEIDVVELSPATSQAFHEKGIKVQVKTLGREWDRPEFWDKAMSSHADWIQTDLPEEVIAFALWKRIPNRPIQISLHRGAGRYAPENTLGAFEKAIRLGADFIEFDVRTTADGKFYLLHDGELSRTTSGAGAIAQASSTVVVNLDAGSWFGKPFEGVKLPSLDDFLSAVRGRINLYFDAKAISPEALSEAIERHHMSERTVVYQSAVYLRKLHAINPRIRSLPPLSNPAELDALASSWSPYAVDASWKILSKDLIDRCHVLGIRVFSDSLGSNEKIEEYQKAIEWGIDLIQTDHPMRLMRALELMTAKSKIR